MSKVRCIANVQLDVVTSDGTTKRRVFAFGDIYNAICIEVVDNDYVNVLLANGDRVDGVSKKVFENLGTKVVKIESVAEFVENDTAEAPEDLVEETSPIPLESVILSEDDEEM